MGREGQDSDDVVFGALPRLKELGLHLGQCLLLSPPSGPPELVTLWPAPEARGEDLFLADALRSRLNLTWGTTLLASPAPAPPPAQLVRVQGPLTPPGMKETFTPLPSFTPLPAQVVAPPLLHAFVVSALVGRSVRVDQTLTVPLYGQPLLFRILTADSPKGAPRGTPLPPRGPPFSPN